MFDRVRPAGPRGDVREGNDPSSGKHVGAGVVLAALLGLSTAGCAYSSGLVIDGDPVVRVLGKDAIRSIDRPKLISASEADEILYEDEPVLGVEYEGEARAYPLWYLEAHEIVNDSLGDLPIAATW